MCLCFFRYHGLVKLNVYTKKHKRTIPKVKPSQRASVTTTAGMSAYYCAWLVHSSTQKRKEIWILIVRGACRGDGQAGKCNLLAASVTVSVAGRSTFLHIQVVYVQSLKQNWLSGMEKCPAFGGTPTKGCALDPLGFLPYSTPHRQPLYPLLLKVLRPAHTGRASRGREQNIYRVW